MHFPISLLVIAMLLLALETNVSLDASEPYEGKVLYADNGRIAVLVETQQTAFLEFAVRAETQIMLDGSPAELKDVRPGHFAIVVADVQGDRLLAEAISAQSTY